MKKSYKSRFQLMIAVDLNVVALVLTLQLDLGSFAVFCVSGIVRIERIIILRSNRQEKLTLLLVSRKKKSLASLPP